MNFREFVKQAEEHLVRHGWNRASHNGVWPLFFKGINCTFPDALVHELWSSVVFEPVVESYLADSGWRRTSFGVTNGQPTFRNGESVKTLRMALIEQLKRHRLSREDMVPRKTPSEMRRHLDVRALKRM